MNTELINQELESLITSIPNIPKNRRYWLVRTQSGKYYDSFIEYNYIAIGHNEVPYSKILELRKEAKDDEKETLKKLKDFCKKKYPEELRPGLIANQILKFIYAIKKGDIVIIPSESSEYIAIGEIQQTPILEITDSDIAKTECPYTKRKKIKWIKKQRRSSLDPYLYKLMQAHQAINDINDYDDVIERTINNFYIKNGEANVILDVRTQDKISAVELFQLGHYLLSYTNDYFNYSKINADINDISVKLNLNSPGKIQLNSKKIRSVFMMALIINGLFGGGLKLNYKGLNIDVGSHDGLIKSVINYQNNKHDREMADKILESLDSLQIKEPDDIIKLLKQASTNKDKPK